MINEGLLESAKQEIFTQLCKNQVLLGLYSKEQIKSRIDANIKLIYTNEVNYDASGGCVFDKPVIKLYDSEPNEKPVTIEDILNDSNRLETLIHEAVHAILKHKDGTGIYNIEHQKRNKIDTFSEIGRGINEGYTNWVVEKCGIDTHSYSLLTSFNRQIEACIGEEAMMKFSKGKLEKIYRALNMSRDEGTAFIRQMDDIYNVEEMILEIQGLEQYLELKIANIQKGENITREDKEKEARAEKYVSKTCVYGEIFTDEEMRTIAVYRDHSSLLYTYTMLLERLRKEFKEPEEKKIKALVDRVETKIIQNLIKGRMDSPKSVQEIAHMVELMKEMKNAIDKYGGKCEEFEKLREKIEDISKQYISLIYKEIDMLINEGNFTAEALRLEYDKICKIFGAKNFFDEKKICKQFAEYVSSKSENPQENALLIEYFLNRDKPIPDDVSIKMTKSQKALVFVNGQLTTILDATKENFYCKEDITLNPNENFEDKADWTQEIGTDFKKIIDDFESLRESKQKQNPKVEIQISNKMVVFKDGENYEVYDVLEGENSGIVKAEIEEGEPVQFMINSKHPIRTKALVPLEAKHGLVTKIKRKLERARLIFRHKKQEVDDNKKEERQQRTEDFFVQKLNVTYKRSELQKENEGKKQKEQER